jgi:hypothetical protein
VTRPSETAAIETQRMVLIETLRLAVPLHMVELDDVPAEHLLAMATRDATAIGSQGDDLQFGGRRAEAAFNALARGLAIAALTTWGGVTWQGLHWCRTPGCADPDDVDAHPQPYPGSTPPPPGPIRDLPDLSAWPPPAA